MSIDDRLRSSANEARARTGGVDVRAARADLARRQRRAVLAIGTCAAALLVTASLSALVWSRAETDAGDRVVAAGVDSDARLQRHAANRFRSAEDASVVVAADGSVLGSVPPRGGGSVLAALARETHRSVVGHVDVKRRLRIETTIDPDVQARLEEAVAGRLRELPDALVATVIALDPASGSVLGLVDPAGLARVPRPHGTAVLPVIAAVALDAGVPADALLPAPAKLTAPDGTIVIDPTALDRGQMTLVDAIEAASPTAFASLAQLVDPVTLVGRVQRAGISSPLTGDTGLLIGRDPIALWDLTAAFRALASGGQLRDVGAIDRVVADTGSVLFDASPTDRAAFLPASAALVLDAIPGAGALGSSLTDQTAIRVTSDVLIGVHVGYRDGRRFPAALAEVGHVAASIAAAVADP